MTDTLKKIVLVVVGVIVCAAGVTFASWQGTGAIADGEVIQAADIKDNFDYLYSIVNTSHVSDDPPICIGSGKALQWDGSEWSCSTDSVYECRLCVRISSNSSLDGDKECSDWSSGGVEEATGSSQWAEANDGTYGGGKYAIQGWIECR